MTGTAVASEPEPGWVIDEVEVASNMFGRIGTITLELDRAASPDPGAYTVRDRDDRRPLTATTVERFSTRLVFLGHTGDPLLADLFDGLALERLPDGRQSASVIDYGAGKPDATLDDAFEKALHVLDLESAEARAIIVVGNGELDPAVPANQPRLRLLKRLAAAERIQTYAMVRPGASASPFISQVIAMTTVNDDDTELRAWVRGAVDRLANRARVVFTDSGEHLTWDDDLHPLVVSADGVDSSEEWVRLPKLASSSSSSPGGWWWVALAGLGAILVGWAWARRPLVIDRREP